MRPFWRFFFDMRLKKEAKKRFLLVKQSFGRALCNRIAMRNSA